MTPSVKCQALFKQYNAIYDLSLFMHGKIDVSPTTKYKAIRCHRSSQQATRGRDRYCNVIGDEISRLWRQRDITVHSLTVVSHSEATIITEHNMYHYVTTATHDKARTWFTQLLEVCVSVCLCVSVLVSVSVCVIIHHKIAGKQTTASAESKDKWLNDAQLSLHALNGYKNKTYSRPWYPLISNPHTRKYYIYRDCVWARVSHSIN